MIVGLRGGGSGKPSARAQRISAISTSELQLRASRAAAPWTQSVQATEPRTDNPGCGLCVTPPPTYDPAGFRNFLTSSHDSSKPRRGHSRKSFSRNCLHPRGDEKPHWGIKLHLPS
jgi:hypothetical protein